MIGKRFRNKIHSKTIWAFYLAPNKIFKVDKLPFTANGKIDRVTLKKMYEGA